MQEPGFSIDQLMELAGYSVAAAAVNFSERFTAGAEKRNVLIVCGPGNNGGDGLVAARHLKQFGYFPSIVYPKQSKGTLFANLVQQMSDLDIPVSNQMPPAFAYEDNAFIVDALFGFSFQGPAREPFASMIKTLSVSSVPVLSVDVPSGWHVEQGDVHGTGYVPHATISLTCPKLCMQGYEGVHYVGGRYAYILHYTPLDLLVCLLTDWLTVADSYHRRLRRSWALLSRTTASTRTRSFYVIAFLTFVFPLSVYFCSSVTLSHPVLCLSSCCSALVPALLQTSPNRPKVPKML